MFQKSNSITYFTAIISSLLISSAVSSSCETLQCKNGGLCYREDVNNVVAEYCICPSMWEGDTCEQQAGCNLGCIHGTCKFPFINGNSVYIPPESGKADFDDQPFCECDPGFTGMLCESTVQICPDNKRKCLNGGKCQELFHSDGRSFKEPKYTCDCGAIDARSPYAGLDCEHPAEKVCSLMTENITSFCVNGGNCKDIVYVDGVHAGCDCHPGFEGDHCEFLKGTDPHKQAMAEEALAEQAAAAMAGASPASSPGMSKGIEGIAMFFIVLVCSAVFIGSLVLMRKLSKRRKALKEASAQYEDNDLSFDADGNRMQNISLGDGSDREGEVI